MSYGREMAGYNLQSIEYVQDPEKSIVLTGVNGFGVSKEISIVLNKDGSDIKKLCTIINDCVVAFKDML